MSTNNSTYYDPRTFTAFRGGVGTVGTVDPVGTVDSTWSRVAALRHIKFTYNLQEIKELRSQIKSVFTHIERELLFYGTGKKGALDTIINIQGMNHIIGPINLIGSISNNQEIRYESLLLISDVYHGYESLFSNIDIYNQFKYIDPDNLPEIYKKIYDHFMLKFIENECHIEKRRVSIHSIYGSLIDRKCRNNMINNSDDLLTFLQTELIINRPKYSAVLNELLALKILNELLALKIIDKPDTSLNANAGLNADPDANADPVVRTIDDLYYYNDLRTESFDLPDIKEYYPAQNVIEYMFSLVEQIFFINTVRVQNAKNYKWNDDVILYELYDIISGELIGLCGFDLFSEFYDYIYAHTIYTGYEHNGITSISFYALLGNLKRLLNINEIKKLFHEYAIVIHGVLSTATIDNHESRRYSGFQFEEDFVECPGYVFEMFLTKNVLYDMSHHYETDEKIPYEYINDLWSIMKFEDTLEEYTNLCYAIANIKSNDDSYIGYDLVSKTYAKKIYEKIKNDSAECLRYRQLILQAGASKKSLKLILDFI